MNELSRAVELFRRKADVRVPPEALRKDGGRFARRRVMQIVHEETGFDRKAPRPALARRIVLRLTDDVDDAEHALPHGRVQDGGVPALHGWAA